MNDRRKTCTTATVLIALVLSMVLSLTALADGSDAVAWLKTQQNADGGFGDPESAPGATADVLLAAAANDENALDWAQVGGETARDYLAGQAASISNAGNIAKVILALVASGVDPRDLGGVDLVAELESMIGEEGKIGGEGAFVNEHAYGMVALSSVQRPIPAASIDYLLKLQIEDGSWSWNGDTSEGSGDNNTAAMAIVALIAAGVPADHAQIQKTIAFFHEQQNEDGGFPYIKPSPYGTDSDANSTAVVIWALLAAGEDPAGTGWKAQGQDGRSALDRLRAFQNESGAFRWQDPAAAGEAPEDNFAATVQAAVAVEMKTLPLATMGVGEAEAAAPAATAPAAGAPEVLPETGANLWMQVFVLMAVGFVLTGAGLLLRQRVRATRSR
jgi:hypothetical protein